MRETRDKQHGEAGFTLLELLVSMTLLAFLLVALLAGIRSGTQIWRATDGAAEGANRIRAAQVELCETLARAYPAFRTDTADAHVDFEGRADAVTFLTPDRDLPGGLSRVTIAATGDGSELALRETAGPELSPPSSSMSRQRVLLRGLRVVEFSYFGKSNAKGTPAWHDEWHNRTALPDLIRIRVAFADSHTRAWPELTIAPRIAADVNCSYDPLTRFCQGR